MVKKNGKGKEYNLQGKLIFEGEYLYNVKIKGKEFIKGRLEFEGEYLYGEKRNGKGYDEYGNIIYELINGNGKVKEYDNCPKYEIEDSSNDENIKEDELVCFNDYLIFEGEYLNGKRNGSGKEYDKHNLEFEEEYLNGKRNGNGKEYYLFGKLKFEGEYLNGQRHGKGKIYDYDGNLIFEGEFLNGNIWKGKGKESFINNYELDFEGEYLNGKRWNGKIKEYNIMHQLLFDGEYINGKKCKLINK